jgi:hypothetical protein
MVASALALVAGAAGASTIMVPGGAPSLEAALDVAQHGDVIEIAAGTYTGDGNRNLVCDKTLTIRGAGAGATTIELDGCAGNEARWISFIAGSQANIEDLSVHGGYVDAGGGVLCVSGTAAPTIARCTFWGNHAAGSGGVFWSAFVEPLPATVFTDCEFRDNSANFAAVVHGNASFERCLFEDNESDALAAVGMGPLEMRDCLIANNASGGATNAVLIVYGGWGRSLENVTVRDNGTVYGISAMGGTARDPVTLTGCTLYNHIINLSVG